VTSATTAACRRFRAVIMTSSPSFLGRCRWSSPRAPARAHTAVPRTAVVRRHVAASLPRHLLRDPVSTWPLIPSAEGDGMGQKPVTVRVQARGGRTSETVVIPTRGGPPIPANVRRFTTGRQRSHLAAMCRPTPLARDQPPRAAFLCQPPFTAGPDALSLLISAFSRPAITGLACRLPDAVTTLGRLNPPKPTRRWSAVRQTPLTAPGARDCPGAQSALLVRAGMTTGAPW